MRYLVFFALLGSAALAQGEFTGNVAVEGKVFFKEAATQKTVPGFAKPFENNQHLFYGSVAAEPEYNLEWDESRQLFSVKLFGRYDYYDDNRTHADVRELTWVRAAESWELRLGIRKVYWGVTESVHLVDIINQTDAVENASGEEKFGQPMVNVAIISDFGTFDLFAMTGFRKRTFTGLEGRPRLPIPVATSEHERYPYPTDTGPAEFESEHGIWQPEGAIRWSHVLGPVDAGLSYFYGTGRDPFFIGEVDLFTGDTIFIPYYEVIQQGGIDLQLTTGAWLFKAESIYRKSESIEYYAGAGGVEYTLYNLFESGIDLGLLLEYLYDDRGSEIEATPVPLGGTSTLARTEPISASSFQNDFFGGLRLTFNDAQSTDLLAGGFVDADTQASLYRLEANRRLGEILKLTIEAQGVVYAPDDDFFLSSQRDDHYLLLELAYFF